MQPFYITLCTQSDIEGLDLAANIGQSSKCIQQLLFYLYSQWAKPAQTVRPIRYCKYLAGIYSTGTNRQIFVNVFMTKWPTIALSDVYRVRTQQGKSEKIRDEVVFL